MNRFAVIVAVVVLTHGFARGAGSGALCEKAKADAQAILADRAVPHSVRGGAVGETECGSASLRRTVLGRVRGGGHGR